jgi:hypothetical protein
MSRSDVTSEHEIEELIAVAERKRRGQRKVLENGLDHDAIDTEAEEETTKRVRRRPKRKAVAEALEADDEQPKQSPGLVTRGIHAGMNGAQLTHNGLVRLGMWGCAAASMIVLLIVFSFYAIDKTPAPMAVTGFQVLWLPGPKVADAEVLTWVRSFPQAAKLRDGEPGVLAALAEHLSKQPIVSEIREVSVVHVPMASHPEQLQRNLRIVVALRQPVLPVVLGSGERAGERAWVDDKGYLLPGTLAGPTARRPVLRAIEWAGIDGVKVALQIWKLLETQVEPGLITDIHLYDVLDQRGLQRGIVLYTRHGSRLIWGRPGDDRYGIKPEDKVRDLVHSMQSQGNVSRVAAINVRFKEPYFVLRDQPYATSQP